MPIMYCQINGQPGYKWGESGKCYIYEKGNNQSMNEARKKAIEQARAILRSHEENE